MRFFRFDAGVGVPLSQFDSRNVAVARGVRTTSATQVGVMHLSANGLLGYHPATTPQLFLVIAGEGWVRGEDAQRVRVVAGQAAFWTKGEWHESGTESGMSAVVVESDTLDPSAYMQAL